MAWSSTFKSSFPFWLDTMQLFCFLHLLVSVGFYLGISIASGHGKAFSEHVKYQEYQPETAGHLSLLWYYKYMISQSKIPLPCKWTKLWHLLPTPPTGLPRLQSTTTISAQLFGAKQMNVIYELELRSTPSIRASPHQGKLRLDRDTEHSTVEVFCRWQLSIGCSRALELFRRQHHMFLWINRTNGLNQGAGDYFLFLR